MIAVSFFSLFRLLFFSYFPFLYRHGVDDYLFLVYFQQSPWQTKLVDTFKLAVTLDGRPTRFDRLERCDTYTFILSVIESASSRGYDIYWARVGNWVVFPAEEKEESVAFLLSCT